MDTCMFVCFPRPIPGEKGLGKLSTFCELAWEPWNAEFQVIMWKINLVNVHYWYGLLLLVECACVCVHY